MQQELPFKLTISTRKIKSETPSLSLLDIACITGEAMEITDKAEALRWMEILYKHAEDGALRIIMSDMSLSGIVAAKRIGRTLHIYELVVLFPEVFKEIAGRLPEFYGKFRLVTYYRKGDPIRRTVNYERVCSLMKLSSPI